MIKDPRKSISHASRKSHQSLLKTGGEVIKVPQISTPSLYDQLIYRLDMLVPENANNELLIPYQHMLQKVKIGDKHRWRAVKDPHANLPAYLTEDLLTPHNYDVAVPRERFFGPLDPTSSFLKKWDMLALALLLFTASVTPFETA